MNRRITLAGALHRFEHAGQRAPKTIGQYDMVLRLLFDHLGANRRLADVTPDEIDAYETRLHTQPRRRGKPLKDSTIAGYVTVIKAFFDWCVRADLIDHSPAAQLRCRHIKPESAASKACPDDDLAAMLAGCRWSSKRNYALILFLADTGCRVGGCASLRISRLDLVQRQAVLLEKGGKLFKARFGPATAEALQEWLKRRPNSDHDFVWTGQGPDYAALTTGGIAAVIRTAAKKSGADRAWGPHSLRHNAGHRLAKGGVPVTGIQAKLGHSSPITTAMFYMPGDDDFIREISDKFAVQPPASSEAPADNILIWDNWRPA